MHRCTIKCIYNYMKYDSLYKFCFVFFFHFSIIDNCFFFGYILTIEQLIYIYIGKLYLSYIFHYIFNIKHAKYLNTMKYKNIEEKNHLLIIIYDYHYILLIII